MHDAGARRACGARPVAHAAGAVYQDELGFFSLWLCVFLSVFISSCFKRKKTTLWPTQMGFLHDNLDTVNHARASSVAGTSSSNRSALSEASPAGTKWSENTVLYVDSHTRQEAETVVFQILGSFLFT